MALVELSAVELRRQIGEKKVSPVELMHACIEQIETYNPAVNAICATDYERALVSAREAEVFTGAGAKSVTLGPRILRAETAAVAGCAVIMNLWGDL